MNDTKLGTTGLSLHNSRFEGMYRALVMDNNDPQQLGRIRAKIYPMFTDIADASLLPWAVPAMPLSVGAGNETGTFCVPDVGTMIWVFFEGGDIYQPVYFAEATDGKRGLPTLLDEDYPTTRGFRTRGGIEFYVDDTIGEVRLAKYKSVTDDSGEGITVSGSAVETLIAFIKMDWDGKITINNPNNITLDSPIIKVTGDLDIATGWTGTFATGDQRTVTVSEGIITNVQ